MTRTAWTLFDPTTNETVSLPVNPNEGGSPGFERNLTIRTPSAIGGVPTVFEGHPRPQEPEVSGVILDEAHYDLLQNWSRRPTQLRLTDDLGRQFWIMIMSFNPKRVRSRTRPYRHTYSLRYLVLQEL